MAGIIRDEHEEVVKYEDNEDGVAVVTLNSPETRNLISGPLTEALVVALQRASDNPATRCIILTASGGVFCAGGNIKDMYARRHHFAGNPAEVRRHYAMGVQRIARTINAVEPPVIAAVNGAAIGAGFDIALMCDLRIASTTAVFAESFVRLGLVSGAGGAWFLSRAVSPALAAELALTGDQFDAERALALGLVSQVVEPDSLMPASRALAERIIRHSPLAVRLNKRLLRDARAQTLEQSLEMAASMQAIAQHSEEHREAVAAVVEKRAPTFQSL